MSKAAIIRQMIADGMNRGDIARSVGVSENFVQAVIWREKNIIRERHRARINSARRYERLKKLSPPPPSRGWSQEESDRAKNMRREGFSSERIALILGRSRNSVIGHLWQERHMIGSLTNWPPEDIERLKKLHSEGCSLVKISATMGKSMRSIRSKMQRLGLLQGSPQWSDERTDRAIDLWKQGLSAGQIAAELGVTRNSVIGRLNRLGLKRGDTDQSWRVRAGALANAKRKAEKAKKKKREGAFLKRPSLLSKLLELPLPAEDPDDVATTTVIDREPHQCSWVIGEAKDMQMCGAPVVPGLGTSWCARHARRGYRLPEPRPFIVQSTAEALRRKKLREAGLLDEFVEPVRESA